MDSLECLINEMWYLFKHDLVQAKYVNIEIVSYNVCFIPYFDELNQIFYILHGQLLIFINLTRTKIMQQRQKNKMSYIYNDWKIKSNKYFFYRG